MQIVQNLLGLFTSDRQLIISAISRRLCFVIFSVIVVGSIRTNCSFDTCLSEQLVRPFVQYCCVAFLHGTYFIRGYCYNDFIVVFYSIRAVKKPVFDCLRGAQFLNFLPVNLFIIMFANVIYTASNEINKTLPLPLLGVEFE